MTVQKQIQSLIADLDRVLSGDSASSSLSDLSQFSESQAVLERVRQGLFSLQQTATMQSQSPLGEDATQWHDQLGEQVASAAIAQMNLQRATWLQPWQMELESMRQQRDSLAREIRQLEAQRQQLIADFLEVLLGRVSENLQQQVSQTLEKIETQSIYNAQAGDRVPEGTWLPPSPSRRLEQLQQLQQQSDRLFMTLDTTFRTVFETLEQDLQGYEQSLSASLKRMYDRSQQGAVLPTEAGGEEVLPPKEEETSEPQEAPVLYPFAGMEIPRDPQSAIAPPADPASSLDIESMDDSQIDALLQLNTNKEEASDPLESEQKPLDRLFISEEPLNPPLPKQNEPEDTALSAGELPPLEFVDREMSEKGVEEQLFGEERTKEPDAISTANPSPEGESTSVEAELFNETKSPPKPPSVSTFEGETAVPPSGSEEMPSLADTITSLTELLDREASLPEEADGEEFISETPVPPGENLLVTEEAELKQELVSERSLEPDQLEQLNQDLEEFQNPLEASPEALSPPQELMGENLENVPLETLSVDSDLWEDAPQQQNSTSKQEEPLPLPAEIATDPWSNPSHKQSEE
ncbi:hypothetical protein [Lusitaniella coriacea]|uniref:hypothetical protein n=1 Tax=Lusitaniella coriacea TaxID=1983105 RepID=UPI003CE8CE3E